MPNDPPSQSQPLTPAQQQELMNELQHLRAREAERQQQMQNMQAAAQREVEAVRRTAEAMTAAARAPPAGSSAIKPPPMQTFNGKVGFEVDTWIRAWERQFTFPGVANHYPANQPSLRVEAAAAYLTGGAADWWDNLDSDTKRDAYTSWDRFVAALRKRFRPVLAAELARARLTALKQKSSVSAYADLFQRELAPIQAEMHPNDQIHHFRAGLKDDRIYAKIVEARPTTLLQAIDIAVSWEAQYARGRNASTAYFRSFSHSSASSSSSGAVPMEVSAIAEEDAEEESTQPSSATRPAASGAEPMLLAQLQAMQKKLDAIERNQVSSSSDNRIAALGKGRVPNRSKEEVARLIREGRCINCCEKGHMKRECTKSWKPMPKNL
jgi:hypothetical protein